ncbi:TRC40/GET3/ArsA family transport-energizing ATPase [Nodosilinea sp. LEGE 07088]|nr:TRC40/GET3/ArsA family transport-energizing ATPase [Nodosilinea sp. LEGE 07088]
MFSGKGGVGKTTLSCGFARQLAQQHPGERVLLLSTDPAHSLGDVLQLTIDNRAIPLPDCPNLRVRALDATALLEQFRADYGTVLELLVERGSFVEGDDLSPVWDMGWPGLDELMALLEIQRILRDREADRVVVDMAPSGHTLSLFALMDFLDTLLESLGQFQQKHRTLTETLSGRYSPDEADQFITDMRHDLEQGRGLIQDCDRTACWVVGIPEPMSQLESERFIAALGRLGVPLGGLVINRVQIDEGQLLASHGQVLAKFQAMAQGQPVLWVPAQTAEPLGGIALDALITCVKSLALADFFPAADAEPDELVRPWAEPLAPGVEDLVTAGRRLVIVGGKGGVGKTTVSAALSWGLAERHPEANLRVMSIDPAHSLGDALGQPLGHEPTQLRSNLQAQEVSADLVLDRFRADYLWDLADMMAGDSDIAEGIQMAYGPAAWRQIVTQALPGIDEMLSLITVMDLLERNEQQLIVLDTAPTGHLLRFLDMPTALGDWLGWIFKLWIKYKDVVGRVEFMGRLRTLRQRVMAAQEKLKDPQHTEFIGVVQNQSAILAEANRLTHTLAERGIAQRYIIHNRYQGQDLPAELFPQQCVVRLGAFTPGPSPFGQVKQAAHLLLTPEAQLLKT